MLGGFGSGGIGLGFGPGLGGFGSGGGGCGPGGTGCGGVHGISTRRRKANGRWPPGGAATARGRTTPGPLCPLSRSSKHHRGRARARGRSRKERARARGGSR